MGLFSSKKYDVYDGKRVKNSFDVRNLKISKRVIGIDDQTFAYFKNMGEVIIPNTVEFIGKEAFKCCEGLLELDMPNSVRTLGASAFEGCKSLRTVKLSENLGNIADETFSGCEMLTVIGIPKSVKTIGKKVFVGCSSLEKIVLEAEVPPTLADNILEYVSPNCRIYVPSESIDKYRAEDKWHDIELYIREIDKSILKLFK